VVETSGASGDKVTGLDFSKAPAKAPKKLTVIPLVNGTGPKAQAGRLVTFNYYGAVWGSKKPFDSSFSRGAPVPFGVGVHGLIPAWDKTIPGLRRGSRVLIIAPPEDAYGSHAQQGIPANSTLVFVVDVLGVDS
jgi:peptidylprolyl isomerase